MIWNRIASLWAPFTAAATERYAPQGVHYWEIINEPNLPGYGWLQSGMNGADYLGAYTWLLAEANQKIRLNDPQSVIVLGGLSPDGAAIDDIWALGGGSCFDIFAWHPYNLGANQWSDFVTEGIRPFLQSHGDDPNKPIWFTEYGSASDADKVAKIDATFAQRTAVNAFFWMSMKDWSEPWGLVSADNTKKAAYTVFAADLAEAKGGGTAFAAPMAQSALVSNGITTSPVADVQTLSATQADRADGTEFISLMVTTENDPASTTLIGIRGTDVQTGISVGRSMTYGRERNVDVSLPITRTAADPNRDKGDDTAASIDFIDGGPVYEWPYSRLLWDTITRGEGNDRISADVDDRVNYSGDATPRYNYQNHRISYGSGSHGMGSTSGTDSMFLASNSADYGLPFMGGVRNSSQTKPPRTARTVKRFNSRTALGIFLSSGPRQGGAGDERRPGLTAGNSSSERMTSNSVIRALKARQHGVTNGNDRYCGSRGSDPLAFKEPSITSLFCCDVVG